MEINYWDCTYADPEEYGEDENHGWLYGCTHPDSKLGSCLLDNKYGGSEASCSLVNEDDLEKRN